MVWVALNYFSAPFREFGGTWPVFQALPQLSPVTSTLDNFADQQPMLVHGSRKAKAKRRIALILTVALAVESASCGTLIHPDRCGQPHTPILDPSIVVLDGLGVLVFLVPGIVAFVVDFSTGAIYLPEPRFNPYPPPPGAYPPAGAYAPPGAAPPPAAYGPPLTSAATGVTFRASSRPLTRINTGAGTLTRERIAEIVSTHLGRRVKLDAPEVRVIRANNLQDASATLRNADNSAAR